MYQITRSVVGCHKEHLSHQEYFTDPGVDESVGQGAVTSQEKIPRLISWTRLAP